MAEGRYFWLKLQKDFFKRNDIRIIEAMPNGKDYILFYLKLLCEAADSDGRLRFSDNIPFDENMLATLTFTNVDIVRAAIKVFTQLSMMEIMDDGTYFMSEVQKMLGSETKWAEKKRQYRESIRDNNGHKEDNVLTMSASSPIRDREREGEKEIEIEIESEEERERESKISTVRDITRPPASDIDIIRPKDETCERYGLFNNVLLTISEFEDLKIRFPDYADKIDKLSCHIKDSRKRYGDHYAVICKWAIEDRAKGQPRPRSGTMPTKEAQKLDAFYAMAEDFGNGG